MADDRELTPTSYIVLGLLDEAPGTPYDLKARVAAGLGNFWTVQHAQLYTETARLAREGFLEEEREDEGRRRKTYSITKAGKAALAAWVKEDAVTDLPEVRDLGLLKLFLGADPKAVATAQTASHKARLKEWENLQQALSSFEVPEGPGQTLGAGLAHERAMVKFWSSLL
ncbi:MAG TPA: PadR family transcriptional regulator [Solirubrobacterales bacterium]|jgi:DNA-binding PadR family transcriptional regulator|nr:PadR family transcriptional regulator [Solirubrobacterales bacterium]